MPWSTGKKFSFYLPLLNFVQDQFNLCGSVCTWIWKLFSSSLILLNKDCFSWLVMCYSHLQVFQLQEFSICWLVVRGVLMPTLWSHYLESLQYLQYLHDSDKQFPRLFEWSDFRFREIFDIWNPTHLVLVSINLM